MLSMARVLALLGVTLLLAAGALWFVARGGGGQLPGTVVVRRGALTLWAPVGLWVGVSLALTVVLNLLARLFR